MIASAFMDGSQLRENLSILRKLGRQYSDAEVPIAEIIDRTEQIRSKRNRFIHGLWMPGTFGEKDGFATVQDLRTTFEETDTSRNWTHGQSEQSSVHDFQWILDEVNQIRTKIGELCAWFEKHEDIEFGYFGKRSMGKPTTYAVNPDGSLTHVQKK